MIEGEAASIYEGTIRHRRFVPTRHDFRYRLFMTYADLDAIEAVLNDLPLGGVGASRWPVAMRYRRSDYFGDPLHSLAAAVRDEVERQSGFRPAGPVWILTHLRQWGLAFNPVSFYYCFAADGSGRVEHIVAEVTNTPWGERHLYVLSAEVEGTDHRDDVVTFEHAKAFHVSPFMPMDQRYRWRFTPPGERLVVHIDNLGGRGFGDDPDDGAKRFDATLDLERRAPLTTGALLKAQCRHPMMPAMVIVRIYRQAAALWLKRTPFHPHPGSTGVDSNDAGPLETS
ncbi:MAG: DUF1365 domain-containing protein [Acidobacteriota bacterium]